MPNIANLPAADVADGAALWNTGFKNYLINGDFQINQRGFAGGALAAGVYGFDRWKAGTGGCNVSLSGVTLTHTSGPLIQVIEAPNLAGRNITVSVEDPSGSVDVDVEGVTGTITAGSGRRGITLAVPAGSTGNISVQLTASGVTYSRVQVELGKAATEFEFRPLSVELALCERYFEKSYEIADAPGAASSSTSIQYNYVNNPAYDKRTFPFRVRKSKSPSITFYSPISGASGKAYNAISSVDIPCLSNTGSTSTWGAAISGQSIGDEIHVHFTAEAGL